VRTPPQLSRPPREHSLIPQSEVRINRPPIQIDRTMFRMHQVVQSLVAKVTSSASLPLCPSARFVVGRSVDGSCRRFINTLPLRRVPKVTFEDQQQQLQQDSSIPQQRIREELPHTARSTFRWQRHTTAEYGKHAGIDLAVILGLCAISGVIAAVLAYARNQADEKSMTSRERDNQLLAARLQKRAQLRDSRDHDGGRHYSPAIEVYHEELHESVNCSELDGLTAQQREEHETALQQLSEQLKDWTVAKSDRFFSVSDHHDRAALLWLQADMLVVDAVLARHQGDASRAEKLIRLARSQLAEAARTLKEQPREPWMDSLSMSDELLLVRISAMRGDWPTAERALQAARDIAAVTLREKEKFLALEAKLMRQPPPAPGTATLPSLSQEQFLIVEAELLQEQHRYDEAANKWAMLLRHRADRTAHDVQSSQHNPLKQHFADYSDVDCLTQRAYCLAQAGDAAGANQTLRVSYKKKAETRIIRATSQEKIDQEEADESRMCDIVSDLPRRRK
jgi:hypothetical protein